MAGLVLDSAKPAPLEETLDAIERLGGRRAREIAEAFMTGDTSEEMQELHQKIVLPLYSQRGVLEADSATMQRVKWNHEVTRHFVAGGRGELPWDQLERVTCPALVLACEMDPVTTAAQARLLAAEMTRADVHLVEFASAGHGAFREVPDEAFAALRRFVSDVASPH